MIDLDPQATLTCYVSDCKQDANIRTLDEIYPSDDSTIFTGMNSVLSEKVDRSVKRNEGGDGVPSALDSNQIIGPNKIECIYGKNNTSYDYLYSCLTDGKYPSKIPELSKVNIDTHDGKLLLLPGSFDLPLLESSYTDEPTFSRRHIFHMSLSWLMKKLAEKYDLDFILIDLGPNFGILNRCFVMNCDYLQPVANMEVFSIASAKAMFESAIPEFYKTWSMYSADMNSEFRNKYIKEFNSRSGENVESLYPGYRLKDQYCRILPIIFTRYATYHIKTLNEKVIAFSATSSLLTFRMYIQDILFSDNERQIRIPDWISSPDDMLLQAVPYVHDAPAVLQEFGRTFPEAHTTDIMKKEINDHYTNQKRQLIKHDVSILAPRFHILAKMYINKLI